MSKKLISMRKIKEILRLSEGKHSQSAIARASNVSRSTVQDYQQRAKLFNVQWEAVKDLTEAEILNLLQFKKGCKAGINKTPLDFEYISKELKRRGVTLELLWQEYFESLEKSYSYSNFCALYRKWSCKQELSFHNTYKAGEKALIDYSGMTVGYYDRESGEEKRAQIFVAALGASDLIYAEAQESQQSASWLAGHVRFFEYIGGVPEILITDNLKAGVSKACCYDPELNPAYQQFSEYYGCAVVPTRSRKPRDKGKVESAVRTVERRILAKFRDQQFFSVGEINTAIKPLLEELNNRKMQGYGCSRWELFKQTDQPELNPLPAQPYIVSDWKRAKVSVDYHIQYLNNYYSVPFTLVGEYVEIKSSECSVEIFHNGQRVACHLKSHSQHRHITLDCHMPESHRSQKHRSACDFISRAERIGPATKQQVEGILKSRKHPEQAFRSCFGLLRLRDKFTSARLEAACKHANSSDIYSRKSVEAILKSEIDKLPSDEHSTTSYPQAHSNIRGNIYYH